MFPSSYVSAKISENGLGIQIAGSQEPEFKFEDLIKSTAFVLQVGTPESERGTQNEAGSIVYAYQWAITRLQEAGFESDTFPLWPCLPSTLSVLQNKTSRNHNSFMRDETHLGMVLNDAFSDKICELFEFIGGDLAFIKAMLTPPKSPAGDEHGVFTVYQFLLNTYINWWCAEKFINAPLENRVEILDELLSHLDKIYSDQGAEANAEESASVEESYNDDGAYEDVVKSDTQILFQKLVQNIQATQRVLRHNVELEKLVPWLLEAEKAKDKQSRRYSHDEFLRYHIQAGWLLVVFLVCLGPVNLGVYQNLKSQFRESSADLQYHTGYSYGKYKLDHYLQSTIKGDIDQHIRRVKWTSGRDYHRERSLVDTYSSSLNGVSEFLSRDLDEPEAEPQAEQEEPEKKPEEAEVTDEDEELSYRPWTSDDESENDV